MPALTGPFAVSIVLLLLAGGFKLWQPRPTTSAMNAAGFPSSDLLTRAVGVAEVTVAFAALFLGGPVPAALVAVFYAGFAVFVVRALLQGTAIQSCGCFGKIDTPPSWAHVIVNSSAAVVAVIHAGTTADPLAGLLFAVDSIPIFLATGVASYLVYVLLAVMPAATAAASS